MKSKAKFRRGLLARLGAGVVVGSLCGSDRGVTVGGQSRG